MFLRIFCILLLMLCSVPCCVAQSGSTPDLILSPQSLPVEGLTRPQDFRIEWTAGKQANDVSVELILFGPDNKPRRFPAKSMDGRTFQVRAVPQPAVQTTEQVSLVVRDARSELTCDAEDREVVVNGKTLRLRQIRQIVREDNKTTVIAEGLKLSGAVKGLEAITADIAGAKVTLDISKADQITLVPIRRVPTPIAYRIVARQGDKVLTESAGRLAISSGNGLGQPVLDPNRDFELLVSNYDAQAIKRFHGKTGAFIDDFAFGNGMAAPHSLAIGPDGLLYVACAVSNTLHRFDGRTGQFLDIFIKPENGKPNGAISFAFGPDGNIYLSSINSNNILRYNGRTGAYIDEFIPSERGGMVRPAYLLFGPDGHLYVGTAQVIKRFHGKTGAFINDFAGMNGTQGINGFTFGPDGNLYVCSTGTHEVKRFDGKTGAFIDTFIPAGRGELQSPMFLAFGPDGYLYVACNGREVKRYHSKTGTYIDTFASGNGLNGPTYLLFRNSSAPLRRAEK